MQYFGCLAVCSEVTTVFLNLIFAIKLFGGNATPHQKLATKVLPPRDEPAASLFLG